MNGKGVQFSHTHHSVLKNQMFHSTLETLMYTDMIQNQTEAQKTRGKMWEVWEKRSKSPDATNENSMDGNQFLKYPHFTQFSDKIKREIWQKKVKFMKLSCKFTGFIHTWDGNTSFHQTIKR